MMSSAAINEVINSFWKLIQRKKYKAALRVFRSDKHNIFHNLPTLQALVSVIKNDSQCTYHEYLIMFLLNNGLGDFMTDAKNSHRCHSDKYHQNVMTFYDLLSFLLNYSPTSIKEYAIDRNSSLNLVQLLLDTLSVRTILGSSYFDRHLRLFWDYITMHPTSTQVKLEFLVDHHFDTAMEAIYVAMCNEQNTLVSCRRYRGRVLQILCVLYEFFSGHRALQFKLDRAQSVLRLMLADYFTLHIRLCDGYSLYSTEHALARLISHRYNFQWFMKRIAADFFTSQKPLIHLQNLYRVFLPFELALTAAQTSHALIPYVDVLANMLHITWNIQQNKHGQIVHNRFLYLTNDADVNQKLGRLVSADGQHHSLVQVCACHLMRLLLRHRMVACFGRVYVLHRRFKHAVIRLLACVSSALQNEEQQIQDSTATDTDNNVFGAMIHSVCDALMAGYSDCLNKTEMTPFIEQLTANNMSFVGHFRRKMFNEIVNYYRRSYLGIRSVRFPVEVHEMIAEYFAPFLCDDFLESLQCGQLMLLNVNNENFSMDKQFVYNEQWMICKVKDVVRGPMHCATQILLTYKIGFQNYGCLWTTIQHQEWIKTQQCWTYNVVVLNQKQTHATLRCAMPTQLDLTLFQSWWLHFGESWTNEEKQYQIAQKRELEKEKREQAQTTVIPKAVVPRYHLTVHTSRQYRKQKR